MYNIDDQEIYYNPIKNIDKKQVLLGKSDDRYEIPDDRDPKNYDKIILDQTGRKYAIKRSKYQNLAEHPLNTTYKEDFVDLMSKGLMLGGALVVSKGASDALGPKYAPMVKGATLVGAGVLIYKLTEQDIKKFYRNYVSRLEGNYEHLIPYNDYRQFVKKYSFKYEEDYYFLNDVLAGKKDPIDMQKFMDMNRYNLKNTSIYGY